MIRKHAPVILKAGNVLPHSPRRILRGAITLSLWLLASLAAAEDSSSVPGYATRSWLKSDASLRSVTFVDADRGWAVGDRGVILVTDTGGDRWELQDSPTHVQLVDVDFVDAKRGAAVGGYYEADTQISRGVLLITLNGGRTWKTYGDDLPFLRGVKMEENGSVLAIGDFSPVHTSAIFHSVDGGRTWAGVSTDGLRRAISMSGSLHGPLNVLGDDGVMHFYATLQTAPLKVLADAHLQRVTGSGPQRIAIGSQNAVYQSTDGGRQWKSVSAPAEFSPLAAAIAPLPSNAGRAETGQTNFYLAGMPGTKILHRHPAGTEESFSTPIHASLNDISFQDAQRGWAVGAFGTILATRDGGRSWRTQRGGNSRAAILVVGDKLTDVPWSFVANEALERGHRVVVSTAQETPHLDPFSPRAATLGTQVACQLGGGEIFEWHPAAPKPTEIASPTSAGREAVGFKLPNSPDQIPTNLESVSIQHALKAYRPRVLVISDKIDPDQRRDWIELAIQNGVQRVLEPTAKSYADWSLYRRALLPQSGLLLVDLQQDTDAILGVRNRSTDDLHFRRTHDALVPLGRSISDPLDGYVRLGTTETRTIETAANRRTLQILQARGSEVAMIQRMLDDGDRNGSFVHRLRLTLSQTPTENRTRLARQILQGCQRTDQPRLYLQALSVVASEIPDTPLGRWAQLRGEALHFSQEWSALHRTRRLQAHTPQPVATNVQFSPFSSDDPSPIRQASSVENLIITPDRTTSHETPQDRSANEFDLSWDFHPMVALIRHRQSSNPEEETLGGTPLTQLAKQSKHLSEMDSWSPLLNPQEANATRALHSAERPFLDGKLNEACWQSKPYRNSQGYDIRFAYDSQHVYWSAVGPRILPQLKGANETTAATRDADLNLGDRLVLKIDIDGDLLTAFALEVDAEGRTRDTCNAFTGWQPMWFVDVRNDQDTICVEAAIRRSDLQTLPIPSGSTWNIRFDHRQGQQNSWEGAQVNAEDWTVVRFQ
ncbi:Ycf48-like protein [Roseimaritima multifibrata]|uniref:Ycf48-like protein n=1 Tax=Roseimaritima multifibrata TaxID=1930274 RepID=A0A517MEV3_9BACT|nr:hypothetical protein [Roseimaritima multifibrata]QDS93409.1 Ycf48-like protein [Roseimaritima multifibrata]